MKEFGKHTGYKISRQKSMVFVYKMQCEKELVLEKKEIRLFISKVMLQTDRWIERESPINSLPSDLNDWSYASYNPAARSFFQLSNLTTGVHIHRPCSGDFPATLAGRYTGSGTVGIQIVLTCDVSSVILYLRFYSLIIF